jgi:VIT1/CCC1 family predicted Fe2+/Mn2+ transporter
VILILGFANLAADGLSMGAGDYLSIKSERASQDGYDERVETRHALKHGAVTWAVFVVAGVIPLLPFMFGLPRPIDFWLSTGAAMLALFSVGAMRSLVSSITWRRGGIEMLTVGSLAGAAAFVAGWYIERALATAR